MIALAWPLVVLVAVALAFVLARRWLDAVEAKERHVATGNSIALQLNERISASNERLDKAEGRIGALELNR